MIIISSGDIPLPLGRETRPLRTAPVGEAFRLPGTGDPSPTYRTGRGGVPPPWDGGPVPHVPHR